MTNSKRRRLAKAAGKVKGYDANMDPTAVIRTLKRNSLLGTADRAERRAKGIR